MSKGTQFPQEMRERAVWLVREQTTGNESEWAAILSVSEKIGCAQEMLRRWVRQADKDTGRREGITTDERQRLKELERENRELRKANEILRLASAYFAKAELDRQQK